MKLSELRYITAEDIEEACVNITSPEAYDEARELNIDMLRLQNRRVVFLREFWAVVLMNYALLPFCFFGTSKTASFFYRVTGAAAPQLLTTLAFAAAFGYFILIRRYYNWKLGAALSCIMLPVHIAFIINVVLNAALLRKMEKIDSALKGQAGYPHFSQLRTTYIRDEEDAEDGVMEEAEPENPFDKYRIRPEDDPGDLADTDINDGI